MITGRSKARELRMRNRKLSAGMEGSFSHPQSRNHDTTEGYDGTKDPDGRIIQLERKTFSIEIQYFGNIHTVKITERGRRGYQAWVAFHPNMITWLKTILYSILDDGSEETKWKERVGEEVYFTQIQKNKEGMYLRVSRFKRGAEDKAYSICFPCGENYQCWSALSQVFSHFIVQNESLAQGRTIGSLRSVAEYPNIVSQATKGVVKISENIGWGRVAVMIKRRCGWDSFLRMDEVNKLTALVQLESFEWRRLWKPEIWEEKGVIIKIYKWQGESFGSITARQRKEEGERAKKISVGKPEMKEDLLIKMDHINKPEKWFKIRGLPTRMWSMEIFKAIGQEMGGLAAITRETLDFKLDKKAHFLRISVEGDVQSIPAVIVTQLDGERIVLTVQWEPHYEAAEGISSQDYLKAVEDFEARVAEYKKYVEVEALDGADDASRRQSSGRLLQEDLNYNLEPGLRVIEEEEGSWVFVPRNRNVGLQHLDSRSRSVAHTDLNSNSKSNSVYGSRYTPISQEEDSGEDSVNRNSDGEVVRKVLEDNVVQNLEKVQQQTEENEGQLIEKTVDSLVQVACSYGSISQVQKETLKKNMTNLVLRYKQRFQHPEDVNNEGMGNGAEEEGVNFLDRGEEEENDVGGGVEDRSSEGIRAAREETFLNGF